MGIDPDGTKANIDTYNSNGGFKVGMRPGDWKCPSFDAGWQTWQGPAVREARAPGTPCIVAGKRVPAATPSKKRS